LTLEFVIWNDSENFYSGDFPMKNILASLVLSLVTSSAMAAAGWVPMKSICFDVGNGINSEKQAMEKCQAFLKDFMQIQNDSLVVQAYCQAGSYPACGQGYNLKAELKAKFMLIEQPMNCTSANP
jgi:hypothetical protein